MFYKIVFYYDFFPITSRDNKVDLIVPKWEKSGFFFRSDSIIFWLWNLIWKGLGNCPIWGQSDPLSAQMWPATVPSFNCYTWDVDWNYLALSLLYVTTVKLYPAIPPNLLIATNLLSTEFFSYIKPLIHPLYRHPPHILYVQTRLHQRKMNWIPPPK